MYLHIVACRVLTRELSALIYDCKNHVSVSWLAQGLHDTPAVLHAAVKGELESIYSQIERKQLRRKPDYIILGYGLCSNALAGIAARDIPLVIPRADDCITLFLGSYARYLDYFTRYGGTYWLTSDWVANTPEIDPDYRENYRKELEEEYGDDEDTIEYMLGLRNELISNYKRVGYISSQVHEDPQMHEHAELYAQNFGLEFMDVDGDNAMLKKMVDGDFFGDDFVIIPPGYEIKFTAGPERIVAAPVQESAS